MEQNKSNFPTPHLYGCAISVLHLSEEAEQSRRNKLLFHLVSGLRTIAIHID